MIKRILTFSCLVISFALNAQDSTTILLSKKGEAILPETKDWCIGVDATPVFNYIANIGKGFSNNIPTITGKYFKDAHTAYRVNVRFGVTNITTRSMVQDRGVTAGGANQIFPLAEYKKENVWKRTGTAIGVSAGIEKRRGKTRLQGFYGGELGVYFASSKDKFTYGNVLSTTGTAVDVSSDDAMTSSVLGNANNVDSTVAIYSKIGSARVTERKNGLTFTFGARAFAGAEYFVLPKLSIGAEFGWGLAFTSYGRSITKYESKGTTDNGIAVNPTTVERKNGSTLKLDNSSLNTLWGSSATLKVCLYF